MPKRTEIVLSAVLALVVISFVAISTTVKSRPG